MKRADFASIKSLKSHIEVNTQKQQMNWLEIRWIRVTKDQPFQFSYKYSHNALVAWKVVDLSRRTKGRWVDMGRIPLHAFMMAHAKSMTKNWRIFSRFSTISHQCFTVSTRSWAAVIGMMRSRGSRSVRLRKLNFTQSQLRLFTLYHQFIFYCQLPIMLFMIWSQKLLQ